MAGSLPEADLLVNHRALQAAAFALLFENPAPVMESEIARRAGLSLDTTSASLAEIDEMGMATARRPASNYRYRRNVDRSDPARDRHRRHDSLDLVRARCRRDHRFPGAGVARSPLPSPAPNQRMLVDFNKEGETTSSAVVFIADGFADGCVVEDWCPTVNFVPGRRCRESMVRGQRHQGSRGDNSGSDAGRNRDVGVPRLSR